MPRKLFCRTEKNPRYGRLSPPNNSILKPPLFYIFTPPATGTLTYGECYVSIPRSHRTGRVETPKWYQRENEKDHIMLHELKVTSLEEFYEEIGLSLKTADSSAAFVFIHGYNVSFEDAAKRTAQIAFDLQFKGIPVFYSWPSEGEFQAYFIDETNIKWTEPNLERFLKDFFTRSDAQKVYLIAHSMGSSALAAAIINISQSIPDLKSRVKEVILAAPDIDADIFKSKIAPALTNGGYPVTLYTSSEDKALAASKKVHKYVRAGDTSAEMVLPGIETIDATGVDTSFIGHSYVAGTRTILT